jgi:hypothetical protein
MNKHIWLALALTLGSTMASAAWIPIEGTEDAIQYFDSTTIRSNGKISKMWVLWDYKKVQTNGEERYLSAKDQLEFNCSEEQYRVIFVYRYAGAMGKGNVTGTSSTSTSASTAWMPVVPDSIGEDLLTVACKK